MNAAPRYALLGAPTNQGVSPYPDGRARRVTEAPAVCRRLGLAGAIGAVDLGDVPAAPFRDFERIPGRIRNEDLVLEHTRALAARIAAALANGWLPVVLGGECTIVLGALLGARSRGRVGLAYVDAHADFSTAATSRTGCTSGMDLAIAVGRDGSPLARLGREGPLVREEDVVLLARKDDADDAFYGDAGPASTRMLDLRATEVTRIGSTAAATEALGRLASSSLAGFWIHVDADVLAPEVMPAVDSPEPGGLNRDALVSLLRPLIAHPKALGLEATIYDPGLDPGLVHGRTWVDVLARALRA